MSTCLSLSDIADYLADRLSPSARHDADVHLAQCEQCRKRLEAQRRHGDQVRQIEDVDQTDIWSDQYQPATDAFVDEPKRAAAAEGIEGYEIREEIGRGGMGVVYRPLQLSTKREVALKVLLAGPFASAAAKRRFEREVELAAQLEHPHIVAILESGIASGRYYFAMRFVDGRRLDRYLSDKRLSLQDILHLFSKICSAVNYAHQKGVIHRDLKSANILVDRDGNPHILDFGLAKVTLPEATETRELTVTGQVMGTLPYLSPEQARGLHQDVDTRSDVYAWG